jgi:hypothetical protein
MTPVDEVKPSPKREKYEAPEIVALGSVIRLTQGMGGDSKDCGGWTIPVKPRPES